MRHLAKRFKAPCISPQVKPAWEIRLWNTTNLCCLFWTRKCCYRNCRIQYSWSLTCLTGGKALEAALQSLTVQNTGCSKRNYRTFKEVEVSPRHILSSKNDEKSPSITLLCLYVCQYSALTLQRDSRGRHSGAILSIETSNLSLCCISNKPCTSSLTTEGRSLLKHDFEDWKWEHISLFNTGTPIKCQAFGWPSNVLF